MITMLKNKNFKVPKAISINNRFSKIEIPQNPWLAENNWGSPHQDSWCSESVSLHGPTNGQLELIIKENPHGYTPNMVCNKNNQMIGVSLDYKDNRFYLIVFDETCNLISSTPLEKHDSSTFGGGYFYLDNSDNTIVVQGNQIASYPTSNVQKEDNLKPNWVSEDVVKLILESSEINSLYSCLPVWDKKHANTFWCLLAGKYNYKDYPKSKLSSPAYIAVIRIDDNSKFKLIEKIELENQWNNNTLAVDEYGAYIVTNGLDMYGECNEGFLWAFGFKDEKLTVRWKTAYKNAGYLKPGQTNIGSGTTPTLTTTKEGVELVAFTDNADPRLNVVVCNRISGDIVAEIPCFEKMRSADEASLIGVEDIFVVENNFGHYTTYPNSQCVQNGPGMDMIMVDSSSEDIKSEKIWKLPDVHFYAMNMLCRESGIIFAHTCSWSDDVSATEGGMYYISAIDSYNGRIIWQIPLGRGTDYCHEYGGIYFNRLDSLFIGTNKYLISIRNIPE